MSQSSYQFIEVIYHPNHFYEVIFKTSHLKALDEWADVLEQIYNLPPDTSVKLLTDMRQVVSPALAYAFRKAQMLIDEYPNRPKPVRIVFLSAEKQGVIDKIVQGFMQLLRNGENFSYIYANKREDALDFLFANEPENRPPSA